MAQDLSLEEVDTFLSHVLAVYNEGEGGTPTKAKKERPKNKDDRANLEARTSGSMTGGTSGGSDNPHTPQKAKGGAPSSLS